MDSGEAILSGSTLFSTLIENDANKWTVADYQGKTGGANVALHSRVHCKLHVYPALGYEKFFSTHMRLNIKILIKIIFQMHAAVYLLRSVDTAILFRY